MICDPIREKLATGATSVATLQHLMICPECRAFRNQLNRQSRLVRELPAPTLPPALRSRILSRLPEPRTVSRSIKRTGMRNVFAAGIGFAVIAGAWFTVPRLVAPPAFAVEVKTAIHNANTWHYVGWRAEGGKKVRWEIWGRRQPFFYREQIGSDVLIDNGQSRLRLLPPDRFQKQGYAISLPSQRLPMTGPTINAGPEQQFIEGIGGDLLDDLYEKESNTREVIFSGVREKGVTKEESLLAINRRSHLPERYRLERAEKAMLPSKRFADSFGPVRTAAELSMEYGGVIPSEVMTQSTPFRFERIDATQGLELRPQVQERDTRGNIHIRVEHWLEGKRLVVGKVFPWFTTNVILQCPPFTQPSEAHYPTDESGRRYLPISGPANVSSGDYTDLWLVPIEPVSRYTKAPRTLTLPVMAKLNFVKGIPDQHATVIWDTIPILSKATTLSLPLPKTPRPLAYDNQPSTEGLQGISPIMPLAFEESMVRYHHHRSEIGENRGIMPGSNPKPARKALLWLESAIAAGESTPGAKNRLTELRGEARRLREQMDSKR